MYVQVYTDTTPTRGHQDTRTPPLYTVELSGGMDEWTGSVSKTIVHHAEAKAKKDFVS